VHRSVRREVSSSIVAAIAVVDRVPVVRQGLALVCREVAAAVTQAESLVELRDFPADGTVVIGVRHESDWRPLEKWCLERRDCAVVSVVETLSCATVERAVSVGASGIVEMSADPERMAAVVRATSKLDTLLPRDVVRELASRAAPRTLLSEVEVEWLEALAQGLTISRLAAKSGYSEREMHRLLKGVYQRLGANTRVQALLVAEREGLLASSWRST
jgi:DNA-binding NarL/FixJ family response regulator